MNLSADRVFSLKTDSVQPALLRESFQSKGVSLDPELTKILEAVGKAGNSDEAYGVLCNASREEGSRFEKDLHRSCRYIFDKHLEVNLGYSESFAWTQPLDELGKLDVACAPRIVAKIERFDAHDPRNFVVVVIDYPGCEGKRPGGIMDSGQTLSDRAVADFVRDLIEIAETLGKVDVRMMKGDLDICSVGAANGQVLVPEWRLRDRGPGETIEKLRRRFERYAHALQQSVNSLFAGSTA